LQAITAQINQETDLPKLQATLQKIESQAGQVPAEQQPFMKALVEKVQQRIETLQQEKK
jgi:hypothetical protein